MRDAPARLTPLTERFERELRAFVEAASTAPTPNLHDAMAYALGLNEGGSRGKRLRPALCLLTAEALGAPIARAIPFALAIELMHNFCLVHDDIEDGDEMRRGLPSLWVRFGAPHAINVGDYLLVQAHRALVEGAPGALSAEERLGLLALLDRALDRTHVGQAMDINARADRETTVERYMELAREKTGRYLAAPIQGGAIVAGAPPAVIERIGDMADLLGPMFQIADDLIDLTEGKGRGEAGSDVREGKRSFLVAWSAARAAPEDRERLFDILDRSRAETTDGDVAWVVRLFERLGAIEAGHAHCERLFEDGRRILQTLPAPLASALEPVLEYLVERRR
jgi:geranylgeranyl pyrophosphate synthase